MVKDDRVKKILTNVFLAHVPVSFKFLFFYLNKIGNSCFVYRSCHIWQVKNDNFRPKCIYTAVMLRRMMDAVLNVDTFDDKVR